MNSCRVTGCFKRLAGLLLSLVLLTACASLPPRGEVEVGDRQKGFASWYGQDFHGRKTASGEIYNMYDLTAAHRTLPLGTQVRVTHRVNGRSVQVRVNDRGPFVRGRILDLSYGAAKELRMVESGVVPVQIEVVGGGAGAVGTGSASGGYTIQVGAFQIRENAERLRGRLSGRYESVMVLPFQSNDQDLYRVRVGSYKTEEDAEEMARRLEVVEGLEAFVTFWDD
jgi:rare lipoprotein A